MTRLANTPGAATAPGSSTHEVHPLRLVIGFSPGSASDDLARLLAPALARELERPVSIDRVQGEDGTRAARLVAACPPDGDTVLMATLGTHALRPHFEPRPGYDPLEDFTPVMRLAQAPLVLATGSGTPYRSLAGAVTACRAEPGQRTFGASAVGGAPFLATELFRLTAGLDIRHVVYDQTAELYADLAAGRIDFSFNNLMSMLPRIRRGELRALAVTATERSATLPDVPAMGEAGMADCTLFNWLGLVGPKAMPAEARDRLGAACQRALSAPDIGVALRASGLTAVPAAAEKFHDFIGSELARWSSVVATAREKDRPAPAPSRS